MLLIAAVALTVAAAPDAHLFAYDAQAPLELVEVGRSKRGGAIVLDVTFKGHPANPPVKAYVVQPTAPGPHAGVLFVHWLGEEKANRTQFLAQAIGLASRGVVSLLVDGMWAQADGEDKKETSWWWTRKHEDDHQRSIRQVIELRRALDVLASFPEVDGGRLGFVGHDFGAMYGTVMGAVDQRPRTYVLIAATPHFTDWYLLGYPKRAPKDLEGYKRQMAQLDPTRYVPHLGAPVFFQFAGKDRYVSREKAEEFYAAAVKPKLTRTYPTDHKMDVRTGALDRFEWLERELKLKR